MQCCQRPQEYVILDEWHHWSCALADKLLPSIHSDQVHQDPGLWYQHIGDPGRLQRHLLHHILQQWNSSFTHWC